MDHHQTQQYIISLKTINVYDYHLFGIGENENMPHRMNDGYDGWLFKAGLKNA